MGHFKILSSVMLVLFATRGTANLKKFKLDDCVCPLLRRPFCSYGPSGGLVQYENFCYAKCSAIAASRSISVVPRFLNSCNPEAAGGRNNDFNSKYVFGGGYPANITENQFLQELGKEATIWKIINTLLAELVYLSNGGGPRCVCPGVNREVQIYSRSGTLETHPNLCSLLCVRSRPSQYGGVGIGPIPSMTHSNIYERETTLDEAKELAEWFKYMETEIKFYRNVSEAMKGFFWKTRENV